MKRALLLLILGSITLLAQVTTLVNVGGPTVDVYSTDSGCGGTRWGPSNDPVMGTLVGVYQTLRYGTNFTCSYSVPNGFYTVTLDLLEPNATAPNTRLFTATVNGVQTPTLDLFSLVGTRTPYLLQLPLNPQYPILVTNGTISIQFKATKGNAVISGIEIRQAPVSVPGPAGPVGLTGMTGATGASGPAGPPVTITCNPSTYCTYDATTGTVTFKVPSGPSAVFANLVRCLEPHQGNSDCTGLLYGVLNGTPVVSPPAPVGFVPDQRWSPVP